MAYNSKPNYEEIHTAIDDETTGFASKYFNEPEKISQHASDLAILAEPENSLQCLYDLENTVHYYRFKFGRKKSQEVIEVAENDSHIIRSSFRTQLKPNPVGMSTYFKYPDIETQEELIGIAKRLVSNGKGILVADESVSTMGNRFNDIGIENTKENRRRFRELLFNTDPAISEFISGAILFHESLYQSTTDGILFTKLLKSRNILIGIKVDKGTVRLYCSNNEVTTQGLDELEARCIHYKKDGCDFAKWRCVLQIGKFTPSVQAIQENANVLARYASICQTYGIVPIVEADILSNGDHNLERAQKVTEKVMAAVYKALNDHHVFLEGTILLINLVTPGTQCPDKTIPSDIGKATVQALQRTVPPAVTGIILLSSGQTEEEAAVNLDAVNKYQGRKPWPLTFSYGRVLQEPVLHCWGGKPEAVPAAQCELLKRTRIMSLASQGWLYLMDPPKKFSIHSNPA